MPKPLIIFISIILLCAGCATVPTRDVVPSYTIAGTSYLSLVSLCNTRGIDIDYDAFSRTIILTKDEHRVNLFIGDAMVLADGNPVHMRHPVDMYEGAVVVPARFKEQIVDVIFKAASLPQERANLSLSRKIKKIVIDAGHGGRDPGAIGRSGLREKDVVLDISKRLTQILKSKGVEVVLTRPTDKFVPLPRRVDITNRSGADIFVSIHANANRVRSLNGFEVYYVSSSVDDSKRALLAARSGPPNLERDYFSGNSLNLKAIVWDMIYADSRAESIELGRSLCRAVRNNLDLRVIGVKDARYYVLKGARMPAVLVETAFLSNKKEERLLRNSYYRQKIAESIAQGLDNYARQLILAEAQR